MPIQNFLRQQRPPEQQRETGEIKHGSVPNVSDLLAPVCFRRLLRHGQALEGVWLGGARDLAGAGEDGEAAAGGDGAEHWGEGRHLFLVMCWLVFEWCVWFGCEEID